MNLIRFFIRGSRGMMLATLVFILIILKRRDTF